MNPLHDADTPLAHDASYVGTWYKKDTKAEDREKAAIVVREAKKDDGTSATGGYIITIKNSEGKPVDFVGHFVEIGGETFVSVTGSEKARQSTMESQYGTMLPVYQIGKVVSLAGYTRVGFMDSAELKKILEKNPAELKHVKTAEKDVLITASSKELRAFCKLHAKDAGLFSGGDDYSKEPPEEK